MHSEPLSGQGEFYPIERVLLVGPLQDAKALADRAAAAGHATTLMLPEEEIEHAGRAHRVLAPGESVGEEDFDLALELHCTDLEAKADALFYLEDALAEKIPILTLTNAISTGELAREMLIPERVAGLSLLPPFAETAFVELMGTLHTKEETLVTAERFFESLGFDQAHRARVADSPGGVLVRTVCCLINEAAFALEEQLTSVRELDLALRVAGGLPQGPLEWGDRIGLDRVLAVLEGLYAEYKDARYRPAPLLKRLVRAGHTGFRAKAGFFTFP